VRIYGGDPSSGAAALGDLQIGNVQAGTSVEFDSTDGQFGFNGAVPINAPIRLYGDVDPDNEIEECNEANNRAGPTKPTQCEIIH
jgi:hypothetical protein